MPHGFGCLADLGFRHDNARGHSRCNCRPGATPCLIGRFTSDRVVSRFACAFSRLGDRLRDVGIEGRRINTIDESNKLAVVAHGAAPQAWCRLPVRAGVFFTAARANPEKVARLFPQKHAPPL